jgi:hypothetical protein
VSPGPVNVLGRGGIFRFAVGVKPTCGGTPQMPEEGGTMSYSSAHPWRATAGMGSRPAVQTAAGLVGALFLLVGILGFIPGITTNYGTMQFAGHGSQAMLFGIFQVSILHNIVHLLFGIAGLSMMRSAGSARAFLIGGGLIYLALWVYGLIFGSETTAANFVPLNNADNWLHLGLAIGMTGLGLALGAGGTSTATPRRDTETPG